MANSKYPPHGSMSRARELEGENRESRSHSAALRTTEGRRKSIASRRFLRQSSGQAPSTRLRVGFRFALSNDMRRDPRMAADTFAGS